MNGLNYASFVMIGIMPILFVNIKRLLCKLYIFEVLIYTYRRALDTVKLKEKRAVIERLGYVLFRAKDCQKRLGKIEEISFQCFVSLTEILFQKFVSRGKKGILPFLISVYL